MWDAIVIGSGIGGLAAACALAKRQRKVLVLEQHSVAGGLTQTFRRQDWTFAPGVHYIGGVGPHEQGLYHEGTRHISTCELRLEGLRPMLLSSSLQDASVVLTVDLTNPDIAFDEDRLWPKGLLIGGYEGGAARAISSAI